MRRKLRPPPPPTPDGHVLAAFANLDGTTFLAPIPNERMEAESAARLEWPECREWRDDPSYFWRRGKR